MVNKENRFPKIKEIMEKIRYTMEKNNREEMDYKLWVINIVSKLENEKYLDLDSYNNLIKKYPQVKELLDDLIKNVEMYSIYDTDPDVTNFDYKAYLIKMKELIE